MADRLMIVNRGKPRREVRPHTRNVSAQLPDSDADAFYKACERQGTTGAAVLRAAAYAYLAEHGEKPDVRGEGLPLTG